MVLFPYFILRKAGLSVCGILQRRWHSSHISLVLRQQNGCFWNETANVTCHILLSWSLLTVWKRSVGTQARNYKKFFDHSRVSVPCYLKGSSLSSWRGMLQMFLPWDYKASKWRSCRSSVSPVCIHRTTGIVIYLTVPDVRQKKRLGQILQKDGGVALIIFPNLQFQVWMLDLFFCSWLCHVWRDHQDQASIPRPCSGEKKPEESKRNLIVFHSGRREQWTSVVML